jgi:hypothetical protein
LNEQYKTDIDFKTLNNEKHTNQDPKLV